MGRDDTTLLVVELLLILALTAASLAPAWAIGQKLDRITCYRQHTRSHAVVIDCDPPGALERFLDSVLTTKGDTP